MTGILTRRRDKIRTQTHTEGRPYEDKERKLPSASQGESPQKKSNLLSP